MNKQQAEEDQTDPGSLPPCQNIYATFCFFLPQSRPDLGNVSQILAISTAKALEQIPCSVKLKWPNDLLLSDKKVGGVLGESLIIEDKICMIVGLGLNVNMPLEQLTQINIPATSLMTELGRTFPIDSVLEFIKDHFNRNLTTFISEGFKSFLPQLKKLLDHSINQKVRFHDHEEILEGIVHSLNDDGSLNLLLPSLQIKKFVSGEILYDPVS